MSKTFVTDRLYQAMTLAFILHGRDTRKESQTPVLSHLFSVCALVQHVSNDEDDAVAALLHDTLEDKPEIVTREYLEYNFGKRVREIVDVSTDTPVEFRGGKKAPWMERKSAYLKRIENEDPGLLTVTIADKIDNARAILADYRHIGGTVWTRFNASSGEILWYYETCLARYEAVGGSPELIELLRPLVTQLHEIIKSSQTLDFIE